MLAAVCEKNNQIQSVLSTTQLSTDKSSLPEFYKYKTETEQRELKSVVFAKAFSVDK